ncbi:hypothetical protein AAZV13_01G021700 [Glycine max]
MHNDQHLDQLQTFMDTCCNALQGVIHTLTNKVGSIPTTSSLKLTLVVDATTPISSFIFLLMTPSTTLSIHQHLITHIPQCQPLISTLRDHITFSTHPLLFHHQGALLQLDHATFNLLNFSLNL